MYKDGTLEILLSLDTQNEVIWLSKSYSSSKKWFNVERLRYNFLESLILAQDERWRRA